MHLENGEGRGRGGGKRHTLFIDSFLSHSFIIQKKRNRHQIKTAYLAHIYERTENYVLPSHHQLQNVYARRMLEQINSCLGVYHCHIHTKFSRY